GLSQIVIGNADTPAWSPDGRYVAYPFNPSERVGGVWLTDPDGKEPQVVLGGVFSRIAWSPDSKSIAVRGISWEGGDPRVIPGAVQGVRENDQVWVVDRASGQATVLTRQAGPGNWSPSWSPDGKSVAAVLANGSVEELRAFPIDGGPSVLLTVAKGIEF